WWPAASVPAWPCSPRWWSFARRVRRDRTTPKVPRLRSGVSGSADGGGAGLGAAARLSVRCGRGLGLGRRRATQAPERPGDLGLDRAQEQHHVERDRPVLHVEEIEALVLGERGVVPRLHLP